MAGLFPSVGPGVAALQLARVRPGAFPLIPARRGAPAPAFDGTFADFLAGSPETDRRALEIQLRNKVRRCSCGKPNGYTLEHCNACGARLPPDFSSTDNVFMGFVYGIRGLPVSLRFQSEELLCFDDLLQLGACHLNCIPTTTYIPDWRTLLKRPKEGLDLIRRLYEQCLTVLREQFYSQEAWRAAWLRGPPPAEALPDLVAAGFNFPPSQYQLHLQFIVHPLLPFQYQMYLKGMHYTPGRFFPYEYVCQVLEANHPLPNADDLDIEEIVSTFNALGIRYADIHSTCYARYGRAHTEAANYSPAQFQAVVVDGARLVDLEPDAGAEGTEVKDVIAADKAAMQSYGAGSPDGPNLSYYAHARKAVVPSW